MTAIPAIEPVERKNSAMPRWRVNHRLMTGVSATGLVNASPTEKETPNAKKKLTGLRANTVQIADITTIAVPSNSTNRVPRRLTSKPASGMARP